MQVSNLIDEDPEITKFLAGFEGVDVTDNTVNNDHPKEQAKINRVKPSADLASLTFVRLIDPIHIPSYLVEQIRDRLYTVDRFYQYEKISCLIPSPQGPQLNESHFLYALINEKLRQVKGFVSMALDLLSNSLVINTFSIDREYWNKGEAINLVDEKAKKMMKDLGLSRIVWITKNPRFCENKSFRRSKEAIMIFEG